MKTFLICLLIIITCIVCSLSITIIVIASKRVKCSDFKTQIEAQMAYEKGASYLDKNKDGIACNSLLLK